MTTQTPDAVREAVQKGLEFVAVTLAFLGRDRGTDRESKTLDGLAIEARALDPIMREALAALDSRAGDAGEGLADCKRCNGRGVIETGNLTNGPGGYGYDTEPCGCEERQAYRDAAEDAGWLIEISGENGVDEGEIATAWAPAGSYTFGLPIMREQVPPGAVYEHGHAPGKLWLNDEPHLMTPDDSSFATTFRVATPAPAVDAECPSSPDGRHQVDTSMESGPNNCFHCEVPMGGRHAQ